MNIKAIVTDIEGTTSSLSFVKDVLFPYAKQYMASFVQENKDKEEVKNLLQDVANEVGQPLSLQQTIAQLIQWIDEDRKVTPLKALQGLIWDLGYRRGDFHGHIYQDAFEYLKRWHEQGIKLYVYSSGSVYAQKLLFGHTEYGDLTPLFSGYFDTHIGQKRETSAYQKIVNQLNMDASDILFLSDIKEELDAAKQAGMKTIWLVRDGRTADTSHPQVMDFTEIALQ